MKNLLRVAGTLTVAGLLASCTQADYDKKRAASGDTAPVQDPKPVVTKEQVTNNANNVAGSVDKGAGQFSDYMKKHGFIIHTKDNPPPDNGGK